MSLFSATVDMKKLQDRDLVIEAVFENMEVKKQVFVKLNDLCSKSCILA